MFSTKKNHSPIPPSASSKTRTTLLSLCATAIQNAVERQETITDDADSDGVRYESVLFTELAYILRSYSVTKHQLRSTMWKAANAYRGPADLDELHDSYENYREFHAWLDSGLKAINEGHKDPTTAGREAVELDGQYFGTWANGKARQPLMCSVLAFLMGATALRDGKAVGYGERQLAHELGSSQQAVHDTIRALRDQHLVEVAEPHVFISEGHPENRVTVWRIAWESLRDAWIEIVGEVSAFCRHLLVDPLRECVAARFAAPIVGKLLETAEGRQERQPIWAEPRVSGASRVFKLAPGGA